MADIFLSYAKEDREPARRIAKVLESCGWSVFWDRKIAAGDNWREVVQSELDGAGAVVVLWSETSVESTWVLDEAERGRRRLVSVLIGKAALPIGFGSVQAIDLIGWEGGRSERHRGADCCSRQDPGAPAAARTPSSRVANPKARDRAGSRLGRSTRRRCSDPPEAVTIAAVDESGDHPRLVSRNERRLRQWDVEAQCRDRRTRQAFFPR